MRQRVLADGLRAALAGVVLAAVERPLQLRQQPVVGHAVEEDGEVVDQEGQVNASG